MVASVSTLSSPAANAVAVRPANVRPEGGIDRDAAQGDPDRDGSRAVSSAPPLSGTAGSAAAPNVLTLNSGGNSSSSATSPAAATSAYARASTSGASGQ